MGRIIALDIGRKRTGVAVTDVLQLIPNGLGYYPTADVVDVVCEYCLKEPVERILIGLPRQMDNSESESTRFITPVQNRLRKLLPHILIELYDERYTTVLAHRAMLDGGLPLMKRRQKGLVDELSAVILLRDYLESRTFKQKQEIK